MSFAYARLFGRGVLNKRLGARAQRFDAFIHDHPFSMTLLIRLLPVGSNVLTNLAAGISRVRAVPFLAASFVGYLPQTVVFALVGSGVDVAQTMKIGLAVVLFLLSGCSAPIFITAIVTASVSTSASMKRLESPLTDEPQFQHGEPFLH